MWFFVSASWWRLNWFYACRNWCVWNNLIIIQFLTPKFDYFSKNHWVNKKTLLFGAELLEAYGHGDKADVDVQPQKLESALFSGPSRLKLCSIDVVYLIGALHQLCTLVYLPINLSRNLTLSLTLKFLWSMKNSYVHWQQIAFKNKKLRCRKEAARCFVSVSSWLQQYKTSSSLLLL